jgi:hypothetical protein
MGDLGSVLENNACLFIVGQIYVEIGRRIWVTHLTMNIRIDDYVTVLITSLDPVMRSKSFTTPQHSNIRVGLLVFGKLSSIFVV